LGSQIINTNEITVRHIPFDQQNVAVFVFGHKQ